MAVWQVNKASYSKSSIASGAASAIASAKASASKAASTLAPKQSSSMASVKANFAAGQASTASKSSSGGKYISTGKRTGGLGQPGGTTPAAAKAATVEARTRGIETSAARSVVGASLSQEARTSPLASTIQYLEDRHGPLDMSSPSAPSRRAIEWMESRSNVETSPSVVASRRASEVAQIQQRSDRIYNDMYAKKAEALGLPATPDTGAIEEKVPDPGRVVVSPDEVPLDDSSMFGGGREGERGRIRSEGSVPPAMKPQVESSTEPLWEPTVGISHTYGGTTREPIKGTVERQVGNPEEGGSIYHKVAMDNVGTTTVAGKIEQTKPASKADELWLENKVYEENK